MRIIDADALGVGRCNPDVMLDRAYAAGWNGIINIINDAPTIDPIRAAGGCRCGECRYWDDDGRCEPPENGLIREYTKPTDFCSYGEAREAQDDG